MRPFLLAGAVAVASILLNVLLRWAAAGGSFRGALLSGRFALAFAVGTATALLMLALYVTRIELGRAILLMGALSILGGTLVGVVFGGDRLHPVEWGLFGAIALLYAWRVLEGARS